MSHLWYFGYSLFSLKLCDGEFAKQIERDRSLHEMYEFHEMYEHHALRQRHRARYEDRAPPSSRDSFLSKYDAWYLLCESDAHMQLMQERKPEAEAFLRQEIAQSVNMECAASGGNLDVIAARVAVGEDVNKAGSFGFTPLMIASRDGQLQACELLIEMNADIGKKGGPSSWTALQYAESENNSSIAELLRRGPCTPVSRYTDESTMYD